MKKIILTSMFVLASCASQKVAIDNTLEDKLNILKNNSKEEITLEDIDNIDLDKFLNSKKVKINALGGIEARALSPELAVNAAVTHYETSGEIDPIITANNKISFPFGLSQPSLACANLRVCSIALEQGEYINNITIGDSHRWDVSISESGVKEAPRAYVMVKPLTADELKTNMIINTDRRDYNIELINVGEEGDITPQIEFFYPQKISTHKNILREKAKFEKEQTISTNINLDNVSFDYKIKGDEDLSWYPKNVFDDGKKVFIEMKKKISTSEVPVFLVDNAGTHEIVNYRYKAPYFIIDRLFDKGVLILGKKGDQEIISLIKERG